MTHSYWMLLARFLALMAVIFYIGVSILQSITPEIIRIAS